VVLASITHLEWASDVGQCVATNEEIADLAGLTRRTTVRAIQELADHGLIVIVTGKSRNHRVGITVASTSTCAKSGIRADNASTSTCAKSGTPRIHDLAHLPTARIPDLAHPLLIEEINLRTKKELNQSVSQSVIIPTHETDGQTDGPSFSFRPEEGKPELNAPGSPEQSEGHMVVMDVATTRFGADIAEGVKESLTELLWLTNDNYTQVANVIASTRKDAELPLAYFMTSARNLGLRGAIVGDKTVIKQSAKTLVKQARDRVRRRLNPGATADDGKPGTSQDDRYRFDAKVREDLKRHRGYFPNQALSNPEIVAIVRKETMATCVRLEWSAERIAAFMPSFEEEAAEWIADTPAHVTAPVLAAPLPQNWRPVSRPA
jgi:Crp-like helix-turn-helix domain